jgi:YesN/AraC family two-component response regulator
MLDKGYRVVGQAGSVHETLECIELMSPDLVVTDVDLPMYNGLIATHRILQRWPRLAIIMVGNYAHIDYHQAALQAGTLDYIDKLDLIHQLPHTMASTAQAVVQGSRPPAPLSRLQAP